jgi:heme exporter protein CcmD
MKPMMADPHIGFVVAAYCVAAVVLAAMIGSVVLDYRRLSGDLDKAMRRLEDARGGARDRGR